MLDDTEHTTRLQRLEECVELRLLIARFQPVMHISECQHHICGSRWADLGKLRRMQFGHDHLAEVRRIVRNALAQRGRIVLGLLTCARDIGSLDGGVVLTMLAHIRRQDFHVPAAAGPDLHHGLVGLSIQRIAGSRADGDTDRAP